MVTNSYQEPM